MAKKIGILTGGGDCPGLNAVIRSVAKCAAQRGWQTYGFMNGFEGLLDLEYKVLSYRDLSGLLFTGGTILGTTNKGKFSAKTGEGVVHQLPAELINACKKNFNDLGLEALVTIGGDGSLTIAQQFFEAGVPIVGVPKTVDNDLEATAMTFGFDSAVACATDALDRLHPTAESHQRVMVLEVMGRHTGWIAIHAGIAGGSDVILIPEIPYRYESIVAKVDAREQEGKHFTLITVAEGAKRLGGKISTVGETDKNREVRLGGVGAVIADEISKRTGKEARVCVLGHLQRGGGPTTFDRLLCTRFGAKAVQLIDEKRFGRMVAFHPPEIDSVPIPEAIGKLRVVPANGELVQTGRALGISFGDE